MQTFWKKNVFKRKFIQILAMIILLIVILHPVTMFLLFKQLKTTAKDTVSSDRIFCPQKETFGCLIDVLEKICTGDKSCLQRNNDESVWLCCCPKPYQKCSKNSMDPTCLKAMESTLGGGVTLYNSNNETLLTSASSTLESVFSIQRIRENIWLQSNEFCRKHFSKPKPFTKCHAKKLNNSRLQRLIEREDLNCEGLTWQYEMLGDGDSDEFKFNNCPVPYKKATENDGNFRKTRI
jgi:hypothetical protein